MSKEQKKSDNTAKFVKFDPQYVGWGGLTAAIADAKQLKVPLVVDNQGQKDRIMCEYLDVEVLLLKDIVKIVPKGPCKPHVFPPIMDVLRNSFEGMSQHPDIKMSGRTTRMLQEVVDYVKNIDVEATKRDSRRIRILVILSMLRASENTKPLLHSMLCDNRYDVVESQNTLSVNNFVVIEFTAPDYLHRYVGFRPPIRFVDHDVIEKTIADGLTDIDRKITMLKTGE